MPTTLTLHDPRTRVKDVILDLTDPRQYAILITFERVEELEDGTVLRRQTVQHVRRTVAFNLDGSVASCDPLIAPLLEPIRTACMGLLAAEAGQTP
jgi:hypothetical protein